MSNDEGVRANEIQLVADEHGLAVFGEPSVVEQFLASEGLVPSGLASTGLGVGRLRGLLRTGSVTAQTGSEVVTNSGRWVKLSEESAKAMKKYGVRESSKSGLSTGVLRGDKGQIKGFVEFVRGPGAGLTNPAMLAGAAGIMAQLAMQQTMDEITDYLARIDAKLDDVLRAQKDSVVSRLTGAGMAIDEAMTVSRARGKVDEVTWSKVQNLSTTIAEVQGYALAQLDALAEKLESAGKVSDIADATTAAARSTQEWLAVLARTFQLQEGLDVLELDRVLDASPDEVDDHRRGLEEARRKRLTDIGVATERLLERIVSAAGTANEKVLLHPSTSPRAVHASERVSGSILEFHGLLGLESAREAVEVRRWSSAAGDVRDRAIDTGGQGVGAVRRGGRAALGRAREGAGGARRSVQALPGRMRFSHGRAAGGTEDHEG
ncbi:hypothetical protein SFC79_06430 [Nocardioides sp. S-58]|uniref:Uncharacterized protein n=1 Tax=Nocardioides renjunii TaxID=3095075 RepID=A0ABU5K8Y0_9ACTN|nr:hypothetical protein [Nocardioides sp. S-58]MDZ5661398.1 hypothetical protein [Nocardioides sp. S-58]